MPVEKRVTHTNHLLDALPRKDRLRFLASCEPVELIFGDILTEPDDTIRHVYFPTDCLISLVSPIDGQARLEVGLVGNEGMHGIGSVLGVDIAPLHALVQGGGEALSMKTAQFRRELNQSPALRRELSRYIYVIMSQLAQTAACTRFHLLEARLARLLVMTQDRAHSNELHITHVFLAYMLGVRRVGITKAASSRSDRKLIHYNRGTITVLDRSGLEAAACSCYRADIATYDHIMN